MSLSERKKVRKKEEFDRNKNLRKLQKKDKKIT